MLLLTQDLMQRKKSINIWGTGKPRRELMFVEDFAEALIYFINKKTREPFVNIGNM